MQIVISMQDDLLLLMSPSLTEYDNSLKPMLTGVENDCTHPFSGIVKSSTFSESGRFCCFESPRAVDGASIATPFRSLLTKVEILDAHQPFCASLFPLSIYKRLIAAALRIVFQVNCCKVQKCFVNCVFCEQIECYIGTHTVCVTHVQQFIQKVL